MVSLSEFERQFYTDAEIKKIEAGARAYDEMAASEISANDQRQAEMEKRVP